MEHLTHMAIGDRSPIRHKEGGFRIRYIVYAALSVLLLLALESHDPEDAAVLSGGIAAVPQNQIGYTGAWISFWAFTCFGLAAYLIEGLLILRTIRCFIPGPPPKFWKPLAGGIMMTLGAMLLLALTPEVCADRTDALGIGRLEVPKMALSGGVIGQWMAAPDLLPEDINANGDVDSPATQPIPAGWLRMLIGAPGTMLFAWTLLAAGALMIFISDWAAIVFAAGGAVQERPAAAAGPGDEAEPAGDEAEPPPMDVPPMGSTMPPVPSP